jgi:stage V sporulation protein D (sporulation-specific penicillin-binding protein)
MTAVDLACNSFGQNFYVTMVQMCAAYSSLVNGGNYYIPHVVKQIVDNDGNVIQNIEPTLVRQTVSKSTSEYMKEALLQVVENGTGSRVQIEGYEIGGKTGTAEKADVGAAVETYTVSFMSVVPAYDPEVIVYVVVDEPHVEKSQNTYQAKDLCKAALEQILPYLNIYPTADDDVSDANGDFTSPEDEDSYDDSTPVIENPEDSEAAQQIREAAQNAQSWTGQSSDGE